MPWERRAPRVKTKRACMQTVNRLSYSVLDIQDAVKTYACKGIHVHDNARTHYHDRCTPLIISWTKKESDAFISKSSSYVTYMHICVMSVKVMVSMKTRMSFSPSVPDSMIPWQQLKATALHSQVYMHPCLWLRSHACAQCMNVVFLFFLYAVYGRKTVHVQTVFIVYKHTCKHNPLKTQISYTWKDACM